MFIHGANVMARVSETQASCVLRDLGSALAELGHTARGKRIVRFYDDAWEFCVERNGANAALSVYRGGPEPMVVVYDRPVVFAEMCASVIDAIDATLGRAPGELDAIGRQLSEVKSLLAKTTEPGVTDAEALAEPVPVRIDDDADAEVAFTAEFAMREGCTDLNATDNGVERADLHALLVRGTLGATIRGREVSLGDAYPFLFADRFLETSRRALDAWVRGQPLNTRLDAGGVSIGLRTTADELTPMASLTLSQAGQATTQARPLLHIVRGGDEGGAQIRRSAATFPELCLFDVIDAAIVFGRSLARAFVRRDRSQSSNLRLSAFRRDLRALTDALRDARRQDTRINPSPEAYRAFAEKRRPPASANDRQFSASPRLRYTQRWKAVVPGIDLRATFLCGDHLIFGAAHETYCVDRTTGALLWQKPTERASSVVTPAGIARISADGSIALHDFATGEITLRTWIAPRPSAPASGAVVSTPGLPRLLIVTEGERHLVAMDLTSGEARWRYAWASGPQTGMLRLKRSGKLLYVASGDSALTAVDVQSGAIIWRMRDRLRFVASPTVDHEALYAIAGGASSAAVLHAVDPFSGQLSWSTPILSGPVNLESGPLLTTSAVCVATSSRRGVRLASFDRRSGAPLFESSEAIAPIGTSWLAVDDLLIGNSPSGELIGLCATTGRERYRHKFPRTLESDVPRRLEPVLRSGALFVPHVEVHVFRPTDGALLGQLGPCEAIPDLLRVDERCDVYIAEESGHVAAFGVGPRLSLVK
jgi:outer membrane protein assembly factor BamB